MQPALTVRAGSCPARGTLYWATGSTVIEKGRTMRTKGTFGELTVRKDLPKSTGSLSDGRFGLPRGGREGHVPTSAARSIGRHWSYSSLVHSHGLRTV